MKSHVFQSCQAGFVWVIFLVVGASALAAAQAAENSSTAQPNQVDQPVSGPAPIIENKPPEEASSEERHWERFELGASIGAQVILNVAFGYWARSVPIVARVSGIYLGDTRGLQLDFGYRFPAFGNDRDYVALSLASWQVSSSFTSWYYVYSQTQRDAFNGIGPTVGFNFDGLSVQLGVFFGQLRANLNYDAGPSGTGTYGNTYFSVQPLFQFGYSFFL